MITNDNYKAPDVMIAELKQQGMKNKQIAVRVFPDLPIKSAEVKVSRYLNKSSVTTYLQESKAQALNELKVNWRELLQTFTDGLNASKTVVHGKDEDSWVEVVPDHTIRMNAAKELMKHLPDDQPTTTPNNDLNEALNNKDIDEVQLMRLIKNK